LGPLFLDPDISGPVCEAGCEAGTRLFRSTSSFGKNEHQIYSRQCGRPVRHDDDDAAPRAHPGDRRRQRCIAIRIEAGIWFIEHD
jgi:hypothetical protein